MPLQELEVALQETDTPLQELEVALQETDTPLQELEVSLQETHKNENTSRILVCTNYSGGVLVL